MLGKPENSRNSFLPFVLQCYRPPCPIWLSHSLLGMHFELRATPMGHKWVALVGAFLWARSELGLHLALRCHRKYIPEVVLGTGCGTWRLALSVASLSTAKWGWGYMGSWLDHGELIWPLRCYVEWEETYIKGTHCLRGGSLFNKKMFILGK